MAIIAATNDDTVNLSILSSAKKLNPKIMTISRENDLGHFSMFESSKIDHVFVPANILIHKTTNALINPLADKFIQLMIHQNETWAVSLVKDLIEVIDENPIMFEMEIDKTHAPEIYEHLIQKDDLTMAIFRTSLRNRELTNNVVPLLLVRDEKEILRPSWHEKIQIDDKILVACDEYARNDIEYIIQNMYEFHYAYSGEEKRTILKRIIK